MLNGVSWGDRSERCVILKDVGWVGEGVLVRPADSGNKRLRAIARQAAFGQEIPLAARKRWPTAFRADCGLGQHTCRVFARKAALRRCNATRNDVEGVDDVDVEVLSDSRWKAWQGQLSDMQKRALLHHPLPQCCIPHRLPPLEHYPCI